MNIIDFDDIFFNSLEDYPDTIDYMAVVLNVKKDCSANDNGFTVIGGGDERR